MFMRTAIGFFLCSGLAAAATHQVTVTGVFGFQPNVVVIQPGDTVRWVNPRGEGQHNVRADSGLFGNAVAANWVFEARFDQPGDFRYFCEIHGGPGGVGMSGMVSVKGTTPPEPEPEPEPDFVINEGVGGSWYNPATSGQGLLLEASTGAGVLTLAWFTWNMAGGEYDWLTGAGPFDGDTAVVDLVRSSGGRFDNPAPVTSAVVGSALLSFQDCGKATLTYTLQDPQASGEIPLQRILPAQPACLQANATPTHEE